MKVILIILIIFVSSNCFAEIYKWVDEKGITHFTDDPASIPEKYQEKAQRRPTEEDLLTPQQRARIKQEEDIKERDRKAQKLVEAERLDIRVSVRKVAWDYYIFYVEARNDGKMVKSISFADFTLITGGNESLPPETGTLSSLSQIQPGTHYNGTVEFRTRTRPKRLVYNPTGETFTVP
jgi:hypothetical protein